MVEFINMGGYGGYVWPAYLFATLLLAVMVLVTLRAFRSAKKSFFELNQHSSNHET